MKAVLIWCAGSAAVILIGLLVKPITPILATGMLLACGIALLAAICLKGS